MLREITYDFRNIKSKVETYVQLLKNDNETMFAEEIRREVSNPRNMRGGRGGQRGMRGRGGYRGRELVPQPQRVPSDSSDRQR